MNTEAVTTSKLDAAEIEWLTDMLEEAKRQAGEATPERIKEKIMRRNPLIRIAMSLNDAVDESIKDGMEAPEGAKEKKDESFKKIIDDLDKNVDEIYQDAKKCLEHASRINLKLAIAKSEL